MRDRRKITQETIAATYGDGSFKNINIRKSTGERKLGRDGKPLPDKWKGYVYAQDGSQIWGVGKTRTAAQSRAKENRDWYNLLLQNGADREEALRRISCARRSKKNLAENDVLGALHLTEAPAKASQRSLVGQPGSRRCWMTPRSFCDEYFLRLAVKTKKVETVRRNERFARMLCGYIPQTLCKPIGSTRFAELDLSYFHEMIRSMQIERRGTSAEDGDNYLSDFRTFVRKFLLWASVYECTPTDWGVVLPSVPRPGAKELDVTDADVGRLFAHADDPRMLTFMIMAYLSGCLNETLGIPFDSVRGNSIHLEQQLGRIENPNFDPRKPAHPKTNPKTVAALVPWMKRDSRRRTLALTDELMAIVIRSVEMAKEVEVVTPTGPRKVRMLIPNGKGGPWQSHNFRLQWNALCGRAGVKMTPHQFRALLTTDEYEAGVGLEMLAEWLGHSGPDTTRKSYRRKRKDQNRLENLMLERSSRLGKILNEQKRG